MLLSRSGHSICPVKALRKYVRGRQQPPTAPLFMHADGSYLTAARLTATLRSLLGSLDYNADHYAGHSFRIGAATTAAAAGLPVCLIKTLGRWSSDCYQRYVRSDKEVFQSVSRALTEARVLAGIRTSKQFTLVPLSTVLQLAIHGAHYTQAVIVTRTRVCTCSVRLWGDVPVFGGRPLHGRSASAAALWLQ